MEKADVRKIVAEIERSKLATNNKRERKIVIRRLFKWLKGEQSPAALDKSSKKISDHKLPETSSLRMRLS